MVGGQAWARRWGAPAVAVALGVLELALVRLAGPPGRQVEALRQLAQVEADPLASVLALLALAAEGLAAYLLGVLALRLLASLPGAVGRLASGTTLLLTPPRSAVYSTCSSAAPCWRRRPSRPSPPVRPRRRRSPPGWPRPS